MSAPPDQHNLFQIMLLSATRWPDQEAGSADAALMAGARYNDAMRKRVLNAVVAASALAWLFCGIMWARSQFVFDEVSWNGAYKQTFVSADGGLYLGLDPIGGQLTSAVWATRDAYDFLNTLDRSGMRFLGFYWRFYSYRPAFGGAIIPYWFLAGVFAALPLYWIYQHRNVFLLRPKALRTMRREIVTLVHDAARVVPTALLLLILGLWFQSYTRGSGWDTPHVTIQSQRGEFFVTWLPSAATADLVPSNFPAQLWSIVRTPAVFLGHNYVDPSAADQASALFGFLYAHNSYPDTDMIPAAYHTVGIPHWFLTLASAILPVVQFRKWRIRRRDRKRFQHGQCQSCGYDLRATPDRCPECGTTV
jgi:hypothetical protein